MSWISKKNSKLTIEIITKSVKTHSKIIRTQLRLIQLRLIQHLVLVYLLLTLGLLLLNKICLTAYVFKFLHILQETGRKLNVHKYYKSSMSEKIAAWRYKIMFLGKVMIIIRQCHAKKNVNELEVSWKKVLTKKISLLQLRSPYQSTAHTVSITNYYKNYFSNMLKA